MEEATHLHDALDDEQDPFYAQNDGHSIDIQVDAQPPTALEFQNLPHTNDPDFQDYQGDESKANLMGAEGGSSLSDEDGSTISASAANSSFFSLNFYRQFYDVTTPLILKRLMKGFIPVGRRFFSEEEKPDMYGPFWICTTLIFLMAVGGNFADYLNTDDDTEWKYNFHLVSWAAWMFYSAISIIPLAVWFAINRTFPKLLVEVISLYGYSFVSYLPACFLCLFPSKPLRMIAMLAATAISTTFTLYNLCQPEQRKQIAPVLMGTAAVHVLIGFISYEWFFSFS